MHGAGRCGCLYGFLASDWPLESLVQTSAAYRYAVRGPHSSGRAVPVNDSLHAHYDKPLRPSLQVGLAVRDDMALECSFRAQSDSLS